LTAQYVRPRLESFSPTGPSGLSSAGERPRAIGVAARPPDVHPPSRDPTTVRPIRRAWPSEHVRRT